MNYMKIQSGGELESAIEDNPGVIIYFSLPDCKLCLSLEPKLRQMLEEEYPKLRLFIIDIKQSPDISGQLMIFSAPTIIVYFEGKEFFRKSRIVSLNELGHLLRKMYDEITSP